MTTPAPAERVELDLLPPAVLRKRAAAVAISAVVFGAALGGVLGLVAGRTPGLVTAAVVAVPLLLLAVAESRRRIWLQGTVLWVRAIGVRQVDLAASDRLDVLVADLRGARSISLLARRGSRAITVGLGMYTAMGGLELGVLALRRLADAVAASAHPRAATVSALLVAQLRSEARGDPLAERPLWLVGGLVAAGRVARPVTGARLDALVAELLP